MIRGIINNKQQLHFFHLGIPISYSYFISPSPIHIWSEKNHKRDQRRKNRRRGKWRRSSGSNREPDQHRERIRRAIHDSGPEKDKRRQTVLDDEPEPEPETETDDPEEMNKRKDDNHASCEIKI